MRRPRFRVRTLMVAVATVGVLLGLGIGWARWREWREETRREQWMLEEVTRLEAQADEFRAKAARGDPYVPQPHGPIPIGKSAAASWREEAEYAADQARICRDWAAEHGRKAARLRRPW